MNRLRYVQSRRAGISLAVLAAVVLWASRAFVTGADTNAPPPKADGPKPKETAPDKKAAKKKLTGAELYAIHCNRCHPERYATEWNSAHWKTIMVHMRVRANLPAAQAKEILKFLQEDSGN
jgi:hypothetical protein